MIYRLAFCPYQKQFKRPLSTSHGNWYHREGIIIRLTDEIGNIGWGEIAPIPWFGSESCEEAVNFCRNLPEEITTEMIFSIPFKLPACQFGFESAWEDLTSPPTPLLVGEGSKSITPPFPTREGGLGLFAGLLPTGIAALEEWENLWQQGYRTFKWKIGIASIEEEIEIFQQLVGRLPSSAKLRLDANGGLNWQSANEWLKICDKFAIEFLEQPLPVNEFDAMLDLSQHYSTPLALDESVATITQLQTYYQQGWQGIFVIKPCIAGSPKLLRQFFQQHQIDAVFSSVFETTIGREAALNLATELSHFSQRNRAMGFGVKHWFIEEETNWLDNLWKTR